jgi:hypothetical protein
VTNRWASATKQLLAQGRLGVDSWIYNVRDCSQRDVARCFYCSFYALWSCHLSVTLDEVSTPKGAPLASSNVRARTVQGPLREKGVLYLALDEVTSEPSVV